VKYYDRIDQDSSRQFKTLHYKTNQDKSRQIKTVKEDKIDQDIIKTFKDRQAAGSKQQRQADSVRRQQTVVCKFPASSSIRHQKTGRQQAANNTDRQTVCSGSRHAADSSMKVLSAEEARRGWEATAPCLFCAAGSSIRHQETDRQQEDSRQQQQTDSVRRQQTGSRQFSVQRRHGRRSAVPLLRNRQQQHQTSRDRQATGSKQHRQANSVREIPDWPKQETFPASYSPTALASPPRPYNT